MRPRRVGEYGIPLEVMLIHNLLDGFSSEAIRHVTYYHHRWTKRMEYLALHKYYHHLRRCVVHRERKKPAGKMFNAYKSEPKYFLGRWNGPEKLMEYTSNNPGIGLFTFVTYFGRGTIFWHASQLSTINTVSICSAIIAVHPQ